MEERPLLQDSRQPVGNGEAREIPPALLELRANLLARPLRLVAYVTTVRLSDTLVYLAWFGLANPNLCETQFLSCFSLGIAIWSSAATSTLNISFSQLFSYLVC